MIAGERGIDSYNSTIRSLGQMKPLDPNGLTNTGNHQKCSNRRGRTFLRDEELRKKCWLL